MFFYNITQNDKFYYKIAITRKIGCNKCSGCLKVLNDRKLVLGTLIT